MQKSLILITLSLLLGAIITVSAVAQPLGGAPAASEYKFSTPMPPGVAVPDKIESSIGTLNLRYGYPETDTVEKIYDNLDRSRALQAYLMAIPIVNQAGMRDSLRQFGPDNQTNVIWENLVDARTVELTANDNTIYNFIWLDSKKGPLVLEIPPEVLGGIDDFLVSLGRRRRHYRRGPRERRQVSRAAARIQGRSPGRLHRPAAEHVWQLAIFPRLSRRWLNEARR